MLRLISNFPTWLNRRLEKHRSFCTCLCRKTALLKHCKLRSKLFWRLMGKWQTHVNQKITTKMVVKPCTLAAFTSWSYAKQNRWLSCWNCLSLCSHAYWTQIMLVYMTLKGSKKKNLVFCQPINTAHSSICTSQINQSNRAGPCSLDVHMYGNT